ncbi:MAG: leucine-rich repeat domain-containing protein, partial [Porticoccaceae bacterium]
MLLRQFVQYILGLVFLVTSSFALSNTEFTYNAIAGGIEVTGCVGSCPSDLVIPASIDGLNVLSIAEDAFHSEAIENLTIHEGLKVINRGAFHSNMLTNLNLPDSLEYLAGFNSNQISTLTIPGNVTHIGIEAFENNRLTDVVFPNSLTSIESETFMGNMLTEVTLPLGLEEIGPVAFMDNNLVTLHVPSNVSYIGEWAFKGNQLTAVYFSGPAISNDDYNIFSDNQIQNIFYCPSTIGWPGEPINGITPELTENCNLNSNPNSDSDGDGILDSVDPDPLDSELLYYSVSDIPNLVPDQTLRDCLTNLASGAEGLGHISDVYCSSRNDDAEDLTPI